MSSVLLVTRPIVPPWDEGSKNTAWQIAANARRHEFHLMTKRASDSQALGDGTIHFYQSVFTKADDKHQIATGYG